MSQSLLSISTSSPSRVEPLNSMSRIVQWFRDDQNPTVMKVGALTLGLIASIGIGYLSGYPILTSLVALSLILWGFLEWKKSNPPLETHVPENTASSRNWFDPTDLVADIDPFYSAIQRIRGAIGGHSVYNRLPIVDMGALTLEGIAQGRLRGGNLPGPICKLGYDTASIAVKVRDLQEERRCLAILFFHLPDSDQWSHSIEGRIAEYGDGTREAEILRQIVLERNHPRYVLAD